MKKQKWVENPEKYMQKIQDIKIKCINCGHKMIMPVFVDKTICSHCGYKVQNNSLLYFKYKMRKITKEKEEK